MQPEALQGFCKKSNGKSATSSDDSNLKWQAIARNRTIYTIGYMALSAKTNGLNWTVFMSASS